MKRTIIITMALTFLCLFAAPVAQAETIIGCDIAPCMAKEKTIDIVIPCVEETECNAAPLKINETITPPTQPTTTQKRKWVRPLHRTNNIP